MVGVKSHWIYHLISRGRIRVNGMKRRVSICFQTGPRRWRRFGNSRWPAH